MCEWHFTNNSTHALLSSMLKIWKEFNKFDLPNDARTLLGSSLLFVYVKSINRGKYWHFSLDKAVISIISALKLEIGTVDRTNLTLNMDGLLLSRLFLAHYNLWISWLWETKVPYEYLVEFIAELVSLINRGFTTPDCAIILVTLSANLII